MSDFDPDKARFYSTEENFNPGYIVGGFKKLFSELSDLTDIIFKSNALRMSKARYTNAKDYLRAFEVTMLAYRDTGPIGNLDTEQQRKILTMVDEVLKGKRECVQFQLNRGCDGIKEVFSSEVFPIKKQDKNK